jgi:hypothetical protein|tara:strand:+ start:94880 stop:95404 length:525 start_codon:yes stop_codon:yes gene_type:complete
LTVLAARMARARSGCADPVETNMRLAVLAASLFLALSSVAAAQPFETPEALLEAFYKPYLDGDFSVDDAVFRSAGLQALYDADAENTPEGEMGALGFDPYIDAQDFELSALRIDTPAISGGYATVVVTFSNFGARRSLSYELVQEADGWKIDDVVSSNADNPYRLSDIFAGAAQ